MYQIKKKAKNYKDATIEKKYEHTITFSIAEIEAHEARLEKVLKEVEGLAEIEGAKVKNLEANHKWVKALAPQDLLAAWMYYESLNRISEILPKRSEIKKQLKEYKKEKAEIVKELGFDESEA